MARTHIYRSQLSWSGSTAAGYRGYSREHAVTTPPADSGLTVTADPSFGGDATLHNPEQLLLAAASSCQLLSFLAIAALAGVTVLGYTDEAEAEMPVARERMRITRIILRPRIVVAAGTDPAQVTAMVAEAHDGCYIANTVNAEMVIEPEISFG